MMMMMMIVVVQPSVLQRLMMSLRKTSIFSITILSLPPQKKNIITYSMEQSLSWEANRFSASQEISLILWNPEVHRRIHKCPPPFSTLSQLDPVHAPHPTFWWSILILSSHLYLGLPSCLIPSCFPTKTLYIPSLSPIRAPKEHNEMKY